MEWEPARADSRQSNGAEPGRVPVIDLRTDGPEALADALISSSCAFVEGHGIASDLFARMTEVSRAFFALPREEKEVVRWPGEGVWHGWMPDGGATDLTDDATPDLVEWYQVNDLGHFALWPERPAGLHAIWAEYYAACRALACRLMTMLATALDLPSEQLPAWTDHQWANLAVNHYPPLREAPRPGQLRLSPHTDECGITILTANNAPGGLEVRIPGSNAWTPITFGPDTFLVQVGDLLARWTNRLIHANVHRVVPPAPELAASPVAARDTLVFFHMPSLDTVVVPAPSCVAATGGTALAPLHCGTHVHRRQETYVSAVPVNIDVPV
ncbi:MAG: 2OG-Fe(II) oxygenase [Acidimicrobiales bacterium]|nr:2OG-Fe(II) oxygenase [Acidimicrobiales bacterium]